MRLKGWDNASDPKFHQVPEGLKCFRIRSEFAMKRIVSDIFVAMPNAYNVYKGESSDSPFSLRNQCVNTSSLATDCKK